MGIIDVKEIGAVGDGVTDDSAVFYAAIDLATSSAVPLSIYVPAANYPINTPLNVIDNTSNLRLFGDGWASNIILNISATALEIASSTGVVISDLRVSGSSITAILFAACSQCSVRRCFVTGATLPGGTPGTFDVAGILFDNCVDCSAENNYCTGNGYRGPDGYYRGVDIGTYSGTDGNHRLFVQGNTCVSSTAMSNMLFFNCDESRVVGNYCSGARLTKADAGGYGVAFYRTGGGVTHGKNLLASNTIMNTQGTGIYMQDQPKSSVIGNYIEKTGQSESDTSLLVAGIGISNRVLCSVVGNQVITNPRVGIAVEGNQHAIIGNIVSACTITGIEVRGTCQHLSVQGNQVTGCGFGISTYDARGGTANYRCTDISVVGNTVDRCNHDGINLTNVDHCTITANTVSAGELNGIHILMPPQLLCQGTPSETAGCAEAAAGILIAGTLNARIFGNISGNSETGHQAFGILEKNAGTQIADSNDFYDNDLRANATSYLVTVGTNSTRSRNRYTEGQLSGTAVLDGGSAQVHTLEIQNGDNVRLANVSPSGHSAFCRLRLV